MSLDDNQIEGIAERLAIAKMEALCNGSDGSFQRGFTIGFIEAFNLMRAINRKSIGKERLCSSMADMEKIRPIGDKPHSLSDIDLDSGLLPPKVPKDLKI